MALIGTATWLGRQGLKTPTSCALEKRCGVRERHHVVSPIPQDPAHLRAQAAAVLCRQTLARLACPTSPGRLGRLPRPPPPPASRRACSRTCREFLQAALCGMASGCQYRQRVRPRSQVGRRGDALCPGLPSAPVSGELVSQEVLRPRRSAEQQEQPRHCKSGRRGMACRNLRVRPDIFVVPPKRDPKRSQKPRSHAPAVACCHATLSFQAHRRREVRGRQRHDRPGSCLRWRQLLPRARRRPQQRHRRRALALAS